jgi:DnaJ family protein A protein 2
MPDKEEPPKDVDTTKYYTLLGVTKESTDREIKSAFRKLALKHHPDKKGGDIKVFQELSTAHEVLIDPEKRKIYDKYGEEGLKSGGPVSASYGDLFSQLFGMGGMGGLGGKEEKRTKEKDVMYPLEVDLEDIYNGAKKNLKVTRKRICAECAGAGGKVGAVKTCTKCKGQGRVMKMVQLGPGMFSQSVADCGECGGKGEIVNEKDRCKKCKGKRVLEDVKVVEVAVEKGMPSGGTISLYGEADEYPGLEPGDVIVQIKVRQHRMYKRKGADLLYKKKISLFESLTGAPFTIEHIDKKTYLIESTPGTVIKPGELKTIIGLGMPFYKTPYNFGNLFIIFEVEFPEGEKLSSKSLQRYNKVLGEQNIPLEFDKSIPVQTLIEFNESQKNDKFGADDEEEEQEGGHYGHGGNARNIECHQQ